MDPHVLPLFAPGARVRARDQTWTVVDRTPHAECAAVTLRADGGPQPRDARTLLVPFDRIQAAERTPRLRFARPRRLLRELARMSLAAQPWGSLRAADTAAIDILAYQLEPALAMAAGATRLLVADDVGLGKTIQAGLMLAELAARGESLRAVIACPAGLRAQWREELFLRFALDATLADSPWLAAQARDLPRDVNPWALPGIYVSSFDLLKRPEVLRPLEEVTWDALIVDEAHNAAAGTARRAALHALALRSRRVVLLTATPHSGDAPDYEALTRLGAFGADEPIAIFRRTRDEIGSGAGRHTSLIGVRPTAAEREMHRLLEDYTARVCREARERGDRAARLAAVVLRKRALSSARSLAASASRRLALLAGTIQPARQAPLPFADEDTLEDAVPDAVLGAPGLSHAETELSLLRSVLAAARDAARAESKLAFLLRLLARVREPVIVFTEYRDTLEHLAAALQRAGLEAANLHGGLDPGARGRTLLQAFEGSQRVLLATDAAAEGLNLHTRCRIVVHFELPWTPGRLEQRTGRVDRFGQRRRVHEIILAARDTAERLVLAPLVGRADRLRLARQGGRTVEGLSESRVIAAILGEDPHGTTLPRASPPEAAAAVAPFRDASVREAARLAALRTQARRKARAGDAGSPVNRILLARLSAPRAPAGETIAIYACELVSTEGRVEHTAVRAVRSAGRPPLLGADASLLAWARRWRDVDEPAFRRALEPYLAEDRRTVGPRHAASVEQALRREESMSAGLPSAARTLVQAGLFDRRAVAAAAARGRVARALLEDIAERTANLQTGLRLDARVRLLAIVVR